MPKPICCLEPLTAFKAFCAQLLFLLLQHFKNGVWMKAKIKSMQVRELIVNFKAGKSNPQFLYMLHDSLIHIPLVSWIPGKHRKHSWEVSLSDLLIIAEWGDRGLTPSNPIVISSASPAAVKVSTYLQRTPPPPSPSGCRRVWSGSGEVLEVSEQQQQAAEQNWRSFEPWLLGWSTKHNSSRWQTSGGRVTRNGSRNLKYLWSAWALQGSLLPTQMCFSALEHITFVDWLHS